MATLRLWSLPFAPLPATLFRRGRDRVGPWGFTVRGVSDEELERSAFGTLDPAAAPVPSFESPAIAQGDDAEPSTRASRDVCYRCRKAMSVCVCDSIPRVVNKTPVIIFQHPRERSHPVGTARFARLGLTRARVIVAHGTGKRGISRDVCVPDGTALLFPSADARPLASLAAHERPKALLVLDGTWSTAGKLFHDNPWMHQLPRVSLQPLTPGNYRIRKEPREECLSTIESIVMALGILDGTDGNDAGMREVEGLTLLLQAFTRMIDTQIVHAKQRVPRHRKPRVQKAFAARMPEAFGSEHHRALVVLHRVLVRRRRPTQQTARAGVRRGRTTEHGRTIRGISFSRGSAQRQARATLRSARDMGGRGQWTGKGSLADGVPLPATSRS